MPKNVELTAKKKLGQNFLVNGGAQLKVFSCFEKIVNQYKPNWIMEIGPGQGDISQHLSDLKLPFFAIEYDHDAINLMSKKEYVVDKKMQICHGDALEIIANRSLVNFFQENTVPDFRADLDLNSRFCLFSSLPYNIGSRILVDMGINYPNLPFTVLLQKEVASKTKISDNKLTVFGIWLNLFWDFTIEGSLAGGNFYPAPRVTSSILTGRPKEKIPEFVETIEKRKIALAVVKKLLAFSKKTLSNNLKGMGWEMEKIAEFMKNENLDIEKARLTKGNYLHLIQKIIQIES